MGIAVVQIIENHAEIAGDLRAIEADPAREGFVTLHVAIQSAHDIAGTPNFFTRDVGQTIDITVRRDSPAAALAPGPIRLRVKKAGGDASFVEEVISGAPLP